MNLKNKLKIWIVTNKSLLLLVRSLIRLKVHLFGKISEPPRSFKLFSVYSKNLGYYPGSHIFDNNMYGAESVLKDYCLKDGNVDSYIEHGPFFGNVILQDQSYYYCERIIAFSEVRKFHLQERIPGKESFAIGPLIHYATPVDISYLRLKKGKTLVFFSSHSTSTVNIEKDVDAIILSLRDVQVAYNIENVVVCLYYLDLDDQVVKAYHENGFMVVTAGSKWDQDFLRRLRTIIEISDFTISSSVGTHIGYSVYLGKPHTIIDIREKVTFNEEHPLIDVVKRLEGNSRRLKELDEIRMEFHQPAIGEVFTSISPSQYSICSKYWGFNEVKTPSELADLL